MSKLSNLRKQDGDRVIKTKVDTNFMTNITHTRVPCSLSLVLSIPHKWEIELIIELKKGTEKTHSGLNSAVPGTTVSYGKTGPLLCRGWCFWNPFRLLLIGLWRRVQQVSRDHVLFLWSKKNIEVSNRDKRETRIPGAKSKFLPRKSNSPTVVLPPANPDGLSVSGSTKVNVQDEEDQFLFLGVLGDRGKFGYQRKSFFITKGGSSE